MEQRKNIAIQPDVHKTMVDYAKKTGLKKNHICDTALIEFLEKRGVKSDWPIDKVAMIKV